MIRTTLNLARHPAENLRRVRVVWGGSLLLLAAFGLVLAAVALVGWSGARPVARQTSLVRAQLAPLLAERARAEAPLRDPAVRAALDQAAFFNQLIDRKAVSWTVLFQRLERITPPGVELVSLRPLQRNGANAVDIRFASDTLEPAIAFVQQLESAPGFADARVEREIEAPPQAANLNRAQAPPPRFQLEVTALYKGGEE